MKAMWDSLGTRFGAGVRASAVAGLVALVLAMAAITLWLWRTDFQPLFTDMAPQDVAAMTAELDRLKIPYQLSDQPDASGGSGSTILVDRAEVYKTRIKLMGKDIPLHGAIGFELFNSSDLGMTEFAQKINYQRALQGELTRTILSLEEIREARVLLALPDQGLFKQATSKPKASVTLTLKPGRTLRAEQVSGIQRLVSSAIPGILVQDVTIVDQRGVALTRSSGEGTEADAGSGSARLDLKKDTEGYLSRKATDVLERALGRGQASASVDVALNMDRVQSNTDELVGAPSKPGGATTGVITRERETARDMGAPLGGNVSTGAAGGSNQREVEYAVGHRVEQVISQPGSVRRIQVAVVILKSLPAAQLDQLRLMVAAAVGASSERGDSVVVQSADGFVSTSGRPAEPVSSTTASESSETGTAGFDAGRSAVAVGIDAPWREALTWASHHAGGLLAMLACLVVALATVLVLVLLMLIGGRPRTVAPVPALSEAERAVLLAKIKVWLQTPSAVSDGSLDAPGARAQSHQRPGFR